MDLPQRERRLSYETIDNLILNMMLAAIEFLCGTVSIGYAENREVGGGQGEGQI